MLNTQLTQASKFPFKQAIKSPPKLALKNYLKASESSSVEILDTIELSEQAKSQPLKSSSFQKIGKFVALGVSLMGAAGLTGCGSSATVPASETPVVSKQVEVKVQEKQVSLEKGTPAPITEQDTAKSSQRSRANPSIIGSEVKSVIDGVTKASQDVKRVSQELKGADRQKVGQVLGREGKRVGQSIGKELKNEVESNIETVKNIGKETKRVRENLRGKNVKEIGQELGKEGKKVGQEIGKEAKKVGQKAKKLWQGLKGKKKRN